MLASQEEYDHCGGNDLWTVHWVLGWETTKCVSVCVSVCVCVGGRMVTKSFDSYIFLTNFVHVHLR